MPRHPIGGGGGGGGGCGTGGNPKSDAIELLNGPLIGKKGGGGGRRCISSMIASLDMGAILFWNVIGGVRTNSGSWRSGAGAGGTSDGGISTSRDGCRGDSGLEAGQAPIIAGSDWCTSEGGDGDGDGVATSIGE